MILESELKDRCTSDIIKRMVELAERFEYIKLPFPLIKYDITQLYANEYKNNYLFPLLIHRAVEGWNKNEVSKTGINIYPDCIEYRYNYEYLYSDYQPQSLTHAECAMLHCLLNKFEEERK